jgi:hypothetical protein
MLLGYSVLVMGCVVWYNIPNLTQTTTLRNIPEENNILYEHSNYIAYLPVLGYPHSAAQAITGTLLVCNTTRHQRSTRWK